MPTLPRRRRDWAIVAASAVLLVIATAILLDAVGPARDAWTAAATLILSATLIAITARYVNLTSELVSAQRAAADAQQKTANRTAQLQAASRALERLLPAQQAAYDLATLFPLQAGASRPPDKELERIINELNKGSAELHLALHFIPDPLGMQLGEAASRISDAVITALALRLALNSEDLAAAREKRPWTWQGAKDTYAAQPRPEPPLEPTPDWNDLLRGTPFKALPNDLNDQLWALRQFLTVA